MSSGNAITLNYQHDYIEDSVLIYSCDECAVYLVADNEKYNGAFVKLSFERARTDCSPAIGIYPKQSGVSFIVELTESKWALEAHKAYVYAGTELRPGARHYVVTNHDIFHEILAKSFTESLIEPSGKEYESVKCYFSK